MALKYGIFAGRKVGEVDGIPISDRAVDQDFLARLNTLLYKNGVFMTDKTNAATVEKDAMTVTMLPADILVQGHFAYDLYEHDVTLPASDAQINTIYAIGYRLNLPERCVERFCKKGVDAKRPALQRDADVYELATAWITVPAGATQITNKDIEDAREDETVCGIVTGAVVSADPTSIFLQQQALLNELREAIADINEGDYYARLVQETITLPLSGWSASAPYKQTVSAPSMAALYEPFADVVLSGTAAEKSGQMEAWGCVSELVTESGTVTAICFEEKPAVTFDVRVKAVV